MQLRMWTYDLAREQAPDLDHLRTFCRTTVEGGYSAIGLYLEYRFAYPSTPWSHGKACVTPEMIRQLEAEFEQIQIIPFINLLGHFEGMLYTEQGKQYREERFAGMQACPCNPNFVQLCKKIIDDTIAAFSSNLIHLGGDETWQLGACENCKAAMEKAIAEGTSDGKAAIYGNHFRPLAEYVFERGRRPAVWGDMFADHPTALEAIPRDTIIFDWQYFTSPAKTAKGFKDRGFDVVCCPTLHVYDAAWMHLPQSEENVRQNVSAALELNAYGVCVTTWESALMGNYDTILPAIKAAGKMLQTEQPTPVEPEDDMRTSGAIPKAESFAAEYKSLSADHARWVELMGTDLQKLGGSFAFTGIRSSLKVRLLLNSNPFLAWLYHAEELTGPVGDKALIILEKAIAIAPDNAYRGVSEFVRLAIDFVRFADQARQAYANELPGVATASLAPCRQIFDNLAKTARANQINAGGSLADVERCIIAREHVERVIKRIKEYGDGSLGYLPAFEIITHPKFVPHDQACWWLINRWANE